MGPVSIGARVDADKALVGDPPSRGEPQLAGPRRGHQQEGARTVRYLGGGSRRVHTVGSGYRLEMRQCLGGGVA